MLMKINPSQKNRGVAVLVALVAVTVLTMLAGAFAYSMKIETRLAANSNNDEKLLWIGRAGIERARWILAQEGNLPYTSLNQIWAGGPGDGPETNGPLNGISLENFPVGEGTVSLKMTELESKINVNGADTALLTQILTTMGANAGDLSVVSDSIQDWTQPGNATRPAGAKSDYYLGLNPPYEAKNGPIDDLSELLMIKGIDEAMFKGGSAGADQGAAFQHHHLGFGNAPGQTPDYPFGLADVFTPYSTGKVNLNTASATVLSVLPGMDAQSAEAVIKVRSGEGGTDGSGAIRSLAQLTASGISQQALAQMQRYADFRGSTYEVHATARIGDYQREFIAVLFRAGQNVTTYGFYWK